MYSSATRTLINVISILGLLGYSELMATVAPVHTVLTFADMLYYMQKSYENVIKLITTNVELDPNTLMLKFKDIIAENNNPSL